MTKLEQKLEKDLIDSKLAYELMQKDLEILKECEQ